MYDGVVNANVLDRFRPIAKDALTRVIREIVRRSISAMEQEAAQPVTVPAGQDHRPEKPAELETAPKPNPQEPSPEQEGCEAAQRGIETTERELHAFGIVKDQFERSALVTTQIYDSSTRKEVPLVLSYKDTTGYFGIFFNKPSWWIMRLYIEGRKNWVGFNVEEGVGTPLVPEGMTLLDPHPHASFRIQITSSDDIDRLHRLVFAAFEKTIRDRIRDSGEPEKAPAIQTQLQQAADANLAMKQTRATPWFYGTSGGQWGRP